MCPKWSNLEQTFSLFKQKNASCPYLSSSSLLLLQCESFRLTHKSYREAKRECFQTKLTSPMALLACLAWKTPLLLWAIQSFQTIFRSLTRLLSSRRQWKCQAKQLKWLMQLEHFHLLSRNCFTISEWHLIFAPNISINLTAGMLWLLIAEGKVVL